MGISKEYEEYQKALDNILFSGWRKESTLLVHDGVDMAFVLNTIQTVQEIIEGEGMILMPSEKCIDRLGFNS